MRRENPNGYWFLAKSHGYGWGFPATWQGWGTFLPLLAPVFMVLLPRNWAGVGFMLLFANVVLVIWACYSHGEPPRWRWGNYDPGPVNPIFPRPERRRRFRRRDQ